MTDTVEFENLRGKKIIGDFYPASSEEAIIMCHGFTGDRHEWGRFDTLADSFNDTGFNVLAFDFSGSGESEDDSLTIEKEIDDLRSAIEFLQGKGYFKIGLFGFSLGGLVCLCNSEKASAIVLIAPVTARKDNFQGELLKEGFIKLEDGSFMFKIKDKEIEVARRKIVVDKRIIEEIGTLNTEELLAGIKCPVLIIHGAEDNSVPIKDSENAIEQLNEDSRLYVIKGADHDFKNQIDEISDLAMDFFKKHL